jgi:hypothetical protein
MSESQVSQGTTLSSPEFKQKLASLYTYLVRHLGIKQSPTLKLINSQENSKNPFGFTGHYDPDNHQIVLYITERHDTDILRSFAHEIIHHWQNERGTLHQNKPIQTSGEGQNNHTHYAQEDPWLRKREMEAYLFGNILFRDWQDEQRMGPPQEPPGIPTPLDENLSLLKASKNPELQGAILKNLVQNFVRDLISNGILTSYHRKLTSGDMQAKDFAEDLEHKILSTIQQWIQTVNDRGNWENQPMRK